MKIRERAVAAAALRTSRRRFAGLLGGSGLLALTGCGGGGSASEPAPVVTPPPAVTPPVAGGSGEPATGTIGVVAGVTGTVSPGIATDSAGNLFFSSGNRVLKRSPAGDVTPVTTTTFVVPMGIAADAAGNVFVVERGEDRVGLYAPIVRRVDKQGHVTTVSGNLPSAGVTGAIAPPIAVGTDGSYYVSAVGALRRVMPDGTFVNVTASEVRRTIDNVAVDSRGNVYFGHDNMVKKIVPGQAEVLLAEGLRFGSNPNGLFAALETSLAVDSAGNVYVANNGDHTIRKISPAGVVAIVAGQAGVAGLETGPLPGKLNAPAGLALQGDKTLYVTSGGTLMKIELP